jgi:drug/metabolite transporter (DMT)-like permease
VRWRRWSATLVGFLGVLIMVRPGAAAFDPAAFFALAMALGIAVAVILLKRFPEGESHVAMLTWFSLAAIALSLGPALYVWRVPTAGEWGLLVAVGLLGLGSQAMFIRAFWVGEASFVAPFDYSKLLLAGLIGFLLFGELPDHWDLAGAAVIIAATVYIARREGQLGGKANSARANSARAGQG